MMPDPPSGPAGTGNGAHPPGPGSGPGSMAAVPAGRSPWQRAQAAQEGWGPAAGSQYELCPAGRPPAQFAGPAAVPGPPRRAAPAPGRAPRSLLRGQLDMPAWLPRFFPVPRRLRRRRWPPAALAALAAAGIMIAATAVVAVAVSHGRPGSLARSAAAASHPARPPPRRASLPAHPAAPPVKVSYTLTRMVASGTTIVATGSRTSGTAVTQQFWTSVDGGRSWQLAAAHIPAGQAPGPGDVATRLAGGPGGWLAAGPHATWLSRDGRSWLLAAAHGPAPALPGDQMWVLTSTAQGYLAGGAGAARPGGPAVLWTSRNGLSWQRETAAQAGLASPGTSVQAIAYATSRGTATLIAGTVTGRGGTRSAAWVSTDGGHRWVPAPVPQDHGAGPVIAGVSFDGSGFIAVRAATEARGQHAGVAYFSPDGREWQYAATISAPGGWTPSVVKGNNYGFVVAGTAGSGQVVPYAAAGAGTVWRQAGPLGAADRLTGAGVVTGPGGTVIGFADPAGAGPAPVLITAAAGGAVRSVPLTAVRLARGEPAWPGDWPGGGDGAYHAVGAPVLSPAPEDP